MLSSKPVLLIAIYGAFLTRDAFGYVDPGMGYLILQAIAAFFLAGMFYFKQIARFVSRKLGRSKKVGSEKQDPSQSDDEKKAS